uniref:Uncharacterized protein n=1 Tax=Tanacetum cinerariifolium TaxID=118510 RepID=A0A6L2P469_TANCI|nr:hypothetical protein [Tanacetum cinerariifolium]
MVVSRALISSKQFLTLVPLGGVDNEGSSPSTRSVNNEAPTIDADPLTAIYPLEFAENIGNSDDAPSEKDEITLIDRTTVEKTLSRRVSLNVLIVKEVEVIRLDVLIVKEVEVISLEGVLQVVGDASDPLDVDSDPDIHEFTFAKELKDSDDCHFVVAHVTPPWWKRNLREICLDKLCDIHDRAYMQQDILDNMLNSRTRKLITTLSKARAFCDAIWEREVEKDKAYAELKRKCNEALLHSEYSRLVLEEKKYVNYEQTMYILYSKVEGLESKRERLKSSDTQLLQEVDRLRCTNLEDVTALKEPFDLEKMHGYRSSSKKEFDQAGDDLATASFRFIAEAIADPYASLEKFLLKKPKSLRTKPALSNSNPLSSRSLVS